VTFDFERTPSGKQATRSGEELGEASGQMKLETV